MNSLKLNLPVKEQPREIAKREIANALLRLSALYQLSGFSEVNAFVLSDWILDNLKHKSMELILEALKNPPVLYENGEVLRNWRLNPDTVFAWVDKKGFEIESLRQVQRSREEQVKLLSDNKMSPECQEMVSSYIKELGNGMFQAKKPIIQSERAKQIDLLLKLLGQYRKESFDPITGKMYEDAMDEREWLLDKGYFIENGEIKEI